MQTSLVRSRQVVDKSKSKINLCDQHICYYFLYLPAALQVSSRSSTSQVATLNVFTPTQETTTQIKYTEQKMY